MGDLDPQFQMQSFRNSGLEIWHSDRIKSIKSIEVHFFPSLSEQTFICLIKLFIHYEIYSLSNVSSYGYYSYRTLSSCKSGLMH